MQSGLVIDAIKIEDTVFGFCLDKVCEGAIAKQIMLEDDEIVHSITFGRSESDNYPLFPCNLSLQTNKRNHGPFSTLKCGSPAYLVDIPPETSLEDYFKENVKTRAIYSMDFFDGFTSEDNIKELNGKSLNVFLE